MEINRERFNILLQHVHFHENGCYKLFDNYGGSVEATYDTDYETDNGLEDGDENFEEYQGIAFKRIDNGNLFEINYHKVPVKVICDEEVVY